MIQYLVFETFTICPPLRDEPPISILAFLGILCLLNKLSKFFGFLYWSQSIHDLAPCKTHILRKIWLYKCTCNLTTFLDLNDNYDEDLFLIFIHKYSIRSFYYLKDHYPGSIVYLPCSTGITICCFTPGEVL